MQQVSRNHSLKIPKQLEVYEKDPNSIEDKIQIKKAVATANDQVFAKQEKNIDQELDYINKIPANANDLMVITVVKKLEAYVIAVTEKSPKKFRGVFVNRMQNYCLETLENLLQANFIRMDTKEKKIQRENYQKEAIIKLKLLGYISMVAQTSGCILLRQYKQISIQLAEAINLIIAWKKSDDARWNQKVGF